eukprot:m.21517 g.21517  ORF g.21517 m.21517 type:complete len:543 (+) comp12448_c0_seq2:506-2134(+)
MPSEKDALSLLMQSSDRKLKNKNRGRKSLSSVSSASISSSGLQCEDAQHKQHAGPDGQTMSANGASAVQCPICPQMVPDAEINRHLDQHFEAENACDGQSRSGPTTASTATGVPHEPTSHSTSIQVHKRRKVTGTVHDFFGGFDASPPGYFVLRWNQNFTAPNASFQREAPEKSGSLVRYGKKFKWQGREVTLYGTSLLEHSDTYGTERDDVPYPVHMVSLLKSHLQKCIRRSRADLACKTAQHLYRMAPLQLLRRLPIIMIEDVVLHASLPVLMWLLAAAGKGYVLSSHMEMWVFGLVEFLARSKRRDPAILTVCAKPQNETKHALTAAVAKCAASTGTGNESGAEDIVTLLYAVQLRRSFGGMKCDMQMLDACTRVWMDRLEMSSANQLPSATARQWRAVLGSVDCDIAPLHPMEKGGPLDPADWELAGVDFHVSDIGTQLATATGCSKEEVAAAMWTYSSSMTNKTQVTPTHASTTSKTARGGEDARGHKSDMTSTGEAAPLAPGTTPASAAELVVWRQCSPHVPRLARAILHKKMRRL